MKIKNILTGLGVIAMAMLTACGDDDVSESGIFGGQSEGAYFGSLPSSANLDKDATSYDVILDRTSTEDALTVTLKSSVTYRKDGKTVDGSSLFSIPSTVTFANGAETAPISIGYNPADLETGVKYTISFEIVDGGCSYRQNAYSIAVQIPASWTEWELMEAKGTYTYSVYFNAEDPECPVYVRQNQADPTIVQYCFGNIGMNDADGNPVPEDEEFGLMFGTNMYVTRNTTTNYCTVEEGNTLYLNTNYNEYVMFCDTYTYTGNAQYQPMSYYDPEIGLFTFNMYYFISLGGWGPGNEYFQLDGFVDYSLEVERRGNYVEGKKEYATFFVYKGADLDYCLYTAIPGNATDEEIEAAIAGLGKDENGDELEDPDKLTESGMIAFEFTENSTYTVVVAGYVGDDVKATYAKAFKIETVQGSSDWEALGYVEYTDGYICSFIPAAEPEPYYVEVEGHKTQEGYYRLVNPYGEPYPWIGAFNYDPNSNSYLVVNAFDPDYVYIEESPSTTSFKSYGAFTFTSTVYDLLQDYSLSTIKQAGIPAGKLDNGVITFDSESLILVVGTDGWMYGNSWPSNYDEEGVTEENYIYEATEKIDFNTLVSASQAKSTVSKAYSKVAAASVAKNRVIKSDMKFDSKLGNASKNASAKPAKAISGKTVSGKSVKTLSGKSVKMNIDPRTATISGSL